MIKHLVHDNSSANARKMDLAYCMIKHVTAEEEDHWPGWTGFNTLLRKDNIPDVSRVGYLPIVDASPTEYSTLNEVLNSGIRIIEKLRLQQTVLVFDEAVYAKVQHIRWKEQSFYDKFVVRLGEFHASMSYLSAISKLFEDGGLKVSFPCHNFLLLFTRMIFNPIMLQCFRLDKLNRVKYSVSKWAALFLIGLMVTLLLDFTHYIL